MLSPSTLMASAGSGLGAGPPTTEPFLMLYWLPWQGQRIEPSTIWLTMQPMCVQTALKPLNSPALGWVTTTLFAVKIMPPPTGTSLVLPSTFAAWPPPAPLVAPGPPLAAPPVSVAVAVTMADGAPGPVGRLAGVLLGAAEAQPLAMPARPAMPAPASTARRVAS